MLNICCLSGKNLRGLIVGKGSVFIRRESRNFPHCKRPVNTISQGYSLVELLIVVAIIITVASIAIPSYSEMVNSTKVVAAIGDIKQIGIEMEFYFVSTGALPASLNEAKIERLTDPWGHPYQYLRLAGAENTNGDGKGKGKGGENGNSGGARKDKNLHPLNSDYDLYSKGRDGDSKLPITAHASRDDIIRANNGGFIGLASEY